MTNENHDFAEAVEIVEAFLKVVGDPQVRAKVQQLNRVLRRAMQMVEDPDRNKAKEAKKGTCPTCRKTYSLLKDGYTLRRHGTGKCFTDSQLPLEIVPALLAIAQVGKRD